MRNHYYKALEDPDGVGLTSVDLLPGSEMGLKGMIVTRVVTTERFRGQGHAREVMQEMLHDADNQGIHLYLEINSYGEMKAEDLEAWYKRLGFRWHHRYPVMVRRPARWLS